MKNIAIIMKKELSRFFGDKRIVLTTILLPGLIIYAMYSLMGSMIANQFTVDDTFTPNIQIVNGSDVVAPMMSGANMDVTEIAPNQIDSAKTKLKNKELDLLVVFPEGFDVSITEHTTGQPTPNIEIFYNSVETNSATAFQMLSSLLDTYESSISNVFNINHTQDTIYDLASEKDSTGQIFSSMMPMLLMVFLFSGCMSVAPEAIAGEKERGTIAALLITPVKRSEIALGKTLALSIVALCSGLSSATGTILSLPKLMGGASDSLNASFYTASDYLMLMGVILTTVLILVTLISIISAFAKTIKEAQTIVMPLMIIVMVIGVTSMFGGGAKTEMFYYMIPLYNSVQCMSQIFSFTIIPSTLMVTLISNLVFTGLGTLLLTKMFNNEKIMFAR